MSQPANLVQSRYTAGIQTHNVLVTSLTLVHHHATQITNFCELAFKHGCCQMQLVMLSVGDNVHL